MAIGINDTAAIAHKSTDRSELAPFVDDWDCRTGSQTHDLKRRGLAVAPKLAVADGALGFWQAIEEVWPQSRGQRCWVHKTANVLNKLPKSQQSKAKRALQEIWMAETKKDAFAAFDVFVETWGVKYDKAVECLVKDRDALLAFYDFPAELAEHWLALFKAYKHGIEQTQPRERLGGHHAKP